MRIAQIGASDRGGGAAVVADGLRRGFTARGHAVRDFVGVKRGRDAHTVLLPDDVRPAYRVTGYAAAQAFLRTVAGHYPGRGFGLASRVLRLATHPRALAACLNGREDFHFPDATRVVAGFAPDIIQTHNLHGGYFDLRALAAMSARVPTVVTLHDMWLLTGHCAHALDCERWRTGCGACPDLDRPPAIARDATAVNWRAKRDIYAVSSLHIVTPSQWLRDRVAASMLGPLARDVRVIPNGVDTAVFRPGDRRAARAALDLPGDAFVVLLTAGSKSGMWTDDGMLRGAVERLTERRLSRPVVFVTVGGQSALALTRGAAARMLPFQHEPAGMARCYQAADVYVQVVRADTFPLAVLEAMACSVPVVATRVGGIPEQIRPAPVAAVETGQVGAATGMLVDGGDAPQLAAAIEALLGNEPSRQALGWNAAADVVARFSLDRQVEAYLTCYRDVSASASPVPAQGSGARTRMEH